jgi:hypothetical protein
MARSRTKTVLYPSEENAREYMRTALPTAFLHKKGGVNGVWELFSRKGAQLPLTYGFSIAEAWQEASLLLGYTGRSV